MILTSPPYGDSRTTVAYGQFSRLSNQWLGIEDANQLDTKLMGGSKISNENFVNQGFAVKNIANTHPPANSQAKARQLS